MEQKPKTELATLPEGVTAEAIKKFEVAIETLTKMNAEALTKTVDLEDPQSYKDVYDTFQVIKNTDTAITKKGKELREDAIRTQKQVISVQDYLSSLIAPGKAHLAAQREIFEAEKERKKKEKEEAEARELNERIEALAKYGATHDITALKMMGEIAFDSLLEEHRVSFEAFEAQRLLEELEAKRKEAELMEKELALEKQRKEQEDRERAIQEKEDAIKRAEEEKAAEIAKERKAKIDLRVSLIIKAGLLLDPEDMFYKYRHVNINSKAVESMVDEEFTEALETICLQINDIKIIEATEQAERIEAAAKRERDRIEFEKIEEENRVKAAETKAAEKEAKRLARMPDKKRLLEAADAILFNMPMPPLVDMKTEEGEEVWKAWKLAASKFQESIIAKINEVFN